MWYVNAIYNGSVYPCFHLIMPRWKLALKYLTLSARSTMVSILTCRLVISWPLGRSLTVLAPPMSISYDNGRSLTVLAPPMNISYDNGRICDVNNIVILSLMWYVCRLSTACYYGQGETCGGAVHVGESCVFGGSCMCMRGELCMKGELCSLTLPRLYFSRV